MHAVSVCAWALVNNRNCVCVCAWVFVCFCVCVSVLDLWVCVLVFVGILGVCMIGPCRCVWDLCVCVCAYLCERVSLCFLAWTSQGREWAGGHA